MIGCIIECADNKTLIIKHLKQIFKKNQSVNNQKFNNIENYVPNHNIGINYISSTFTILKQVLN